MRHATRHKIRLNLSQGLQLALRTPCHHKRESWLADSRAEDRQEEEVKHARLEAGAGRSGGSSNGEESPGSNKPLRVEISRT